MKPRILLSMVVACGLGLGCAGRSPHDSSTMSAASGGDVRDTAHPSSTRGASGDDVRVIHFEFDSSEIAARYATTLDAWSGRLIANPSHAIRLEGHADERGTREYNVGLGERRAIAVRRALVARGVAESQLSVISYGEDRAAANGNDESAWRMNRRVEFFE